MMTATYYSKSIFAALSIVALGFYCDRAVSGPDDDAPFQSDGVKANAVQPIIGGGSLADYPTNSEPASGLRILPPTGTQLIR